MFCDFATRDPIGDPLGDAARPHRPDRRRRGGHFCVRGSLYYNSDDNDTIMV